MISKNQVKLIRSLHQKKYRDENNLFIAEGEKVVGELIASNLNIKNIYLTKEFLNKTQLSLNKNSYEIITEAELSKITALTTSQGILAVAEIPQTSPKESGVLRTNLKPQTSNELSLVLDEIKDPGNLGTIIRIADWFGIKNIICSINSADAYNPKVVQAAMGSLFRINITYADLLDFFQKNENKLPVYGTLLNGENIYEANLSNKGFIIIGNESKGISKELLPFISNKISIPSFSTQKIDSLNAAMAAAIVCSEFRRRK